MKIKINYICSDVKTSIIANQYNGYWYTSIS